MALTHEEANEAAARAETWPKGCGGAWHLEMPTDDAYGVASYLPELGVEGG